MKVSIDDQELYTLSEIQKKVIMNDIPEDIFEEDMKRRLTILLHKYDCCLGRLKAEWFPKLQERYEVLPTNSDQLAELIFSQPDYKCRKTRLAEEAAVQEQR